MSDRRRDVERDPDSASDGEHVRETMRMAMDVGHPGVFGRVVSGFDRSDAAESLLGALLFGIPMFVEGGTQGSARTSPTIPCSWSRRTR